MAQDGDSYTASLKLSQLDWGKHRYTNSRIHIPNERYLPIPIAYARRFNILNGNGTNGRDILGKNLFRCSSADGTFQALLRAQGCIKAGDIYAKQFSVNKDLKALSSWYIKIGACDGTQVLVEWTSPYDILLTKL